MKPHAWRAAGHVAVTVVLVLGLLLAGLVLGYLSAGQTGSPTTLAVVQTVVVLVGGVLLVRRRVVVGRRRGLRARPWTCVSAIAAVGLWPLTWAGIGLLGWQLVGRGPVAGAVDLLLWSAAVAIGVLWGTSEEELQVRPAAPYA